MKKSMRYLKNRLLDSWKGILWVKGKIPCLLGRHSQKEDWDLDKCLHIRFCERCGRIIECIVFKRDPEQERKFLEDDGLFSEWGDDY